MDTVAVTENIPGMTCVKNSDGSYACTTQSSMMPMISKGIKYVWFLNGFVFFLITPILIITVVYRLFFIKKDSAKGKKFLRVVVIFFWISISILIIGWGMNIMSPWMYR